MVIINPERDKRMAAKAAERAAGQKGFNYDPTIKPPEFYGDAHETGIVGLTFKPPWPTAIGWVCRTRRVADLIRADQPVFELGCGFGILAAMLWHEGFHRANYLGWDFCPDAIAVAKKGNAKEAHQNALWVTSDLDDDAGRERVRISVEAQPDNLAVVSCETLEHLEHDRELVEAIPSGTFCIFSVPQFWARSHLRKFQTPGIAHERYGEFLEARYRQFQFYPKPESGWILIWGYRK